MSIKFFRLKTDFSLVFLPNFAFKAKGRFVCVHLRRPAYSLSISGDRSLPFNNLHFVVNYRLFCVSDPLLCTVRRFNEDSSIHGILVQLPLPIHVNETRVLDEVHRAKDVDGFHPLNIGQLAMKGYEPSFVCGTPKGCLELLLREKIPIAGKHAVVLGRSNIVGIPMSLLLLKQNATVTVCHSRTENIGDFVKQADIVVAAIGKPLFVKKEWIKPGATIIDVGINSIPDATRKTGYVCRVSAENQPF